MVSGGRPASAVQAAWRRHRRRRCASPVPLFTNDRRTPILSCCAGFHLLFNDTFSGALDTSAWRVMTGDGSAVRRPPPASPLGGDAPARTGLHLPHPMCRRPALLPPPLVQLKAKGWLDGEKQVYTTINARASNGVLSLRATKSPSGGIYSGRVHSNKFWMPRPNNGQYNIIRFETRFRVDAGGLA